MLKQRKKYTIIIGLLFTVMILPITAYGWNDSRPPHTHINSSGFLSVEGDKIVDEKGKDIFLRGINTGPFTFASHKDDNGHTLDQIDNFNERLYTHFFTEKDMQDIRSMGANVLRVHSFLKFWTLETEPSQWDAGFVEVLDYIVDIACKKGVYVIITMAAAGQNEPQNETGFGHTLWTDNELQSRVVAGWKYIAQHYADNACVAGYDLLNEPDPPSKEALHAFYSNVIAAIRSVDSRHMIFLDRKHFPKETEILWGGIYDDENIVLQTHEYADATEYAENHPETVDYPTREELEQEFEDFFSLPQVLEEIQDRPLFNGEFSSVWGSENRGLQWTRNMIEIMNQRNIHWTYFSYKNVYGKERGLYVRNGKWWLFDWTEEQQLNLEITEEQLSRLDTSNFQIHPDVSQILENGFRGKVIKAKPGKVPQNK